MSTGVGFVGMGAASAVSVQRGVGFWRFAFRTVLSLLVFDLTIAMLPLAWAQSCASALIATTLVTFVVTTLSVQARPDWFLKCFFLTLALAVTAADAVFNTPFGYGLLITMTSGEWSFGR